MGIRQNIICQFLVWTVSAKFFLSKICMVRYVHMIITLTYYGKMWSAIITDNAGHSITTWTLINMYLTNLQHKHMWYHVILYINHVMLYTDHVMHDNLHNTYYQCMPRVQ